jgi:hypothetical protein
VRIVQHCQKMCHDCTIKKKCSRRKPIDFLRYESVIERRELERCCSYVGGVVRRKEALWLHWGAICSHSFVALPTKEPHVDHHARTYGFYGIRSTPLSSVARAGIEPKCIMLSSGQMRRRIQHIVVNCPLHFPTAGLGQ